MKNQKKRVNRRIISVEKLHFSLALSDIIAIFAVLKHPIECIYDVERGKCSLNMGFFYAHTEKICRSLLITNVYGCFSHIFQCFTHRNYGCFSERELAAVFLSKC